MTKQFNQFNTLIRIYRTDLTHAVTAQYLLQRFYPDAERIICEVIWMRTVLMSTLAQWFVENWLAKIQ